MGKTNNDLMAPGASPGTPSVKSGVRRVNNVPLFLALAALAVFLTIMALVAYDRSASQQARLPSTAATTGGATTMFAKELAGERKDGIVEAKAAAVPPPAALPVSLPVSSPEPTLLIPPGGASGVPAPMPGQPVRSLQDDSAERIRIMRLQQLDEAVKAPTAVPFGAVRGGNGQPPAPMSGPRQLADTARADPATTYRDAVRQQPVAAAMPQPGAGQGGAGSAGSSVTSGRGDVGQFTGGGQSDRWRLDAQPEPPRSPYELRAGFVIPAMLISGINSELPGQIVAQVSQDVYDTPLGRYKLIPQGARLVGAYTNDIAYGQSRVLVAWQRIVFPDGRVMDIGAMPGGDSAGYAGFNDRVNNHYLRLFSSAFLMSAVTAGIAVSQPEATTVNGRPSASSAMSEALGQQLGQVTAQLIAKNLNIAPTLEIRPGYRFNVIVTKDLTFAKPFTPFDY